MDVVTIAITGAAGLVGRQLVPALAGDPSVARVVGLDVREPIRHVPGVEFHLADVLHRELKPLLEGVDVLVHLASVVDPIPDEQLMARVNVEGTRRVLDAAAAVGVRKVVRVSSAAVYGAWADNPVPLTEDAPLRPNPRFSPAVQAAEVERLLAEWRDDHPGSVVTILRTAPVLGPGAERLPSRLLLGRPRLRVRGATPPIQATHVDDLVSAIALVTLADHPGTFNVASDRWIDHDDVHALLRPSPVPAMPAELLERALARTWSTGLGEVPPGVIPYLVHPWIVDNTALKSKGWRPTHSNQEAIRDGLSSLPKPPTRERTLVLAAGIALGAVVTYAFMRRRRSN
ncbi:MAG: NAD-dependent epimerase/dehydratase family protein [Acidimicrobiia bacterium]